MSISSRCAPRAQPRRVTNRGGFGILEERTPLPSYNHSGFTGVSDKIVDAIRSGVEVYALKTKSKSKVTVFEVLGLTAASAEDVMSTLSAHHAVSVGQRDKRVQIENEKAFDVKNDVF
jgi:uncharacterized protein YycO